MWVIQLAFLLFGVLVFLACHPDSLLEVEAAALPDVPRAPHANYIS